MTAAAAAVVGGLLATPGTAPAQADGPGAPIRLSESSTVAPACDVAFEPGLVAEPHVAADPAHPNQLTASWVQNFTAGGAQAMLGRSSDGGRTWTFAPSAAGSANCAGGGATRLGVADDWLSTGPSGITYHAMLSPDPSNGTAFQVNVETSADGGRTWGPASVVAVGPLVDKEMVVADPAKASRAYIVWNDDTLGVRMPLVVAVTEDAGRTWTKRSTAIPGPEAPGATLGTQDAGAQLAVLDDGTLVLAYVRNYLDGRPDKVMATTSLDGGRCWSSPVVLDDAKVEDTIDADGDAVSTLNGLSMVSSGNRAVAVWADNQSDPHSSGTLRVKTFSNGVWREEAPLTSQAAMVLPAVSVDHRNRIGVTWYDLRDDASNEKGKIRAAVFGAVLGGSASGQRLTEPFDILTASANGRNGAAFVGDYTGLAPTPDGFVALVALAGQYGVNGRTDIYALRFD